MKCDDRVGGSPVETVGETAARHFVQTYETFARHRSSSVQQRLGSPHESADSKQEQGGQDQSQ
jgi:hypothetical protein